MKYARGLWLITAFALTSVLLPAQVEFTMQTSVPFPFVVADTKIPAGNCTFIVNSGRARLTVRSRTNGVTTPGGHLVFTGDPFSGKPKNELVFQRIGEERFLSEVWVNNQGLSVAKPKRQAELEKTRAVATEVKLVIR